jgi:hypothetical protein
MVLLGWQPPPKDSDQRFGVQRLAIAFAEKKARARSKQARQASPKKRRD